MLLLKNYTNLYTHPSQSNQIVQIMKQFMNKESILVDANAGMGGDSVFFCKNFKFIYCIEKNKSCIDYIEHNLQEYNNKEIFNINCIDALKLLQFDAIYFDPPWGGKTYKNKISLELFLNDDFYKQINIIELINSLYFNTKFIFIKVPLNFKTNNLQNLLWKHIIFPIFKFNNNSPKKIFNLIVFLK